MDVIQTLRVQNPMHSTLVFRVIDAPVVDVDVVLFVVSFSRVECRTFPSVFTADRRLRSPA